METNIPKEKPHQPDSMEVRFNKLFKRDDGTLNIGKYDDEILLNFIRNEKELSQADGYMEGYSDREKILNKR